MRQQLIELAKSKLFSSYWNISLFYRAFDKKIISPDSIWPLEIKIGPRYLDSLADNEYRESLD